MTLNSEILAPQPPTSPRRTNKGAEIRARIAANRAKRLRIADAMKLVAGVTEHTVHKEDFGGLPYIGTGKIYSPEGRKIVQLYTLAHECGHIFLHNSGPGYAFPSHVKEFEAESYAQALREHGMTAPHKLSSWGREYVASCIAKDRAGNVPIDPRAMAYATGRRSPYEPLRMVPSTWTIFRADEPPGAPTIAARRGWTETLLNYVRGSLANRLLQRFVWNVPERLARETFAVFRLAAGCTLHGTAACLFGLLIFQEFQPMPDAFPMRPGDVTGPDFLTSVAGGLLLANLAVLWRATTRHSFRQR